MNDGYLHTTQDGTIDCQGQPISLDGSHRDITLNGNCTRIRVTGSHVDLTAYIPPGARIELTGSSTDVVWRLTRRGPAPQLINTGSNNNFYRNSRLSSYQDHDWYQEQK